MCDQCYAPQVRVRTGRGTNVYIEIQTECTEGKLVQLHDTEDSDLVSIHRERSKIC